MILTRLINSHATLNIVAGICSLGAPVLFLTQHIVLGLLVTAIALLAHAKSKQLP